MSYWVYVTLSCHNWKRNDFHCSGAYLFTSFVYCTNVYWSVIHGIKRKPHLSVVWNWYHFVAIAILHQPRPTDSADINTRLQLSDTSSIPPMHGGFLLLQCFICVFCPQLIRNVRSRRRIDSSSIIAHPVNSDAHLGEIVKMLSQELDIYIYSSW